MQRASAALQLAGWVGRKGRGVASLRWNDSELQIKINALQIVGVVGDNGEVLASAFGATDEGDWFAQAKAAVAANQVSEGEAVAVVKRALQDKLRSFFLAEEAEVLFDPGIPSEESGFTLSYPHLVVELVLGVGGDGLVAVFLPDAEMVLRRLPEFPQRVGSLRLTDEAMAILAKINDVRSAQEIADPSPHGRSTVAQLLAAAVGGGLVELTPRIGDVALAEATRRPLPAAPRKRASWLWLLILLAVLVVAALLWWKPGTTGQGGGGGPWAVAVDAGCQPAELERLYRRQDQDPDELAVVPFETSGERCYRLVWGHFPDQARAEAAMQRLPAGLATRGFSPHVVKVGAGAP
jgi:hypothetical protein